MEVNLYSADAVHLTTAISEEAIAFISFDSDFQKKIERIPVLNPMDINFKKQINDLFSS